MLSWPATGITRRAVTREDPFTVWQLSIIGSLLFAAIIAAQCRCALQAAVINVEMCSAAAEALREIAMSTRKAARGA
jgi:hypothetical protein